MKKSPEYLVFGGYVISKTDGQEHYVGTGQLLKLYQIFPDECRQVDILGKNDIHASIQREALMKTYPNAKIMRPRYDGKYKPVKRRLI